MDIENMIHDVVLVIANGSQGLYVFNQLVFQNRSITLDKFSNIMGDRLFKLETIKVNEKMEEKINQYAGFPVNLLHLL